MILLLIRGENSFYKQSRNWSKTLLRIAGIKVQIDGEIPHNNSSIILIANHTSLFDIPILLANIKVDFGIIYKKELEKIPVFGWVLGKSPFIGIIRENPKKSFAGMLEAVKKIDDGKSVLVFPEGTRSKSGKMGDFKRGAFMIAEKSSADLLPIAISNAHKTIDNNSIVSTKVKLKLLDLIPGETINKNSMEEIEQLLRNNLPKDQK